MSQAIDCLLLDKNHSRLWQWATPAGAYDSSEYESSFSLDMGSYRFLSRNGKCNWRWRRKLVSFVWSQSVIGWIILYSALSLATREKPVSCPPHDVVNTRYKTKALSQLPELKLSISQTFILHLFMWSSIEKVRRSAVRIRFWFVFIVNDKIDIKCVNYWFLNNNLNLK